MQETLAKTFSVFFCWVLEVMIFDLMVLQF